MKELVPSEPEFTEKVLEYQDKMGDFLSDQAKFAQVVNKVPKRGRDRERFMAALAEAFEIIGGVPRLALWADRNQTEFYKILSKQVPGLVQNALMVKASGPVTIVSAIPQSVLDGEATEIPQDE
jgi:hypothetical protein